MRSTKFVILMCSFFLVSKLQAQVDAPVMGDIIQLIDLLKKDYQLIDPDQRDEVIANDRRLVIAIFNAYLADEQRSKISPSGSGTSGKDVVTAKQAYNSAVKAQEALKSSHAILMKNTIVKPDELMKFELEFKTNADIFEVTTSRKREVYYKALFNYDKEQLSQLYCIYLDNKNTFITTIIESFKNKYDLLTKLEYDAFATPNYNASIQKGLPLVGGSLSFETLIDGLGKFLADRIKEELVSNVLQGLREELMNPGLNNRFAELMVILPKTMIFLKNFQGERITNFPNEIRGFIEEDLNSLPVNAVKLKDTPRIQTLIDVKPWVGIVFEGANFVNKVSKIEQPMDYFSLMDNSDLLNIWGAPGSNWELQNAANLFRSSKLLAFSMLTTDGGSKKFASMNAIRSYSGEINFYQLYIGLLYQQDLKYYGTQIYKSAGEKVFLSETLSKIMAVCTYHPDELLRHKNEVNGFLSRFSEHVEVVNAAAAEIRKANKAGQKIGADTIYRFVGSMIDFSEDMLRGGEEMFRSFYFVPASVHIYDSGAFVYFESARKINLVVKNLLDKKFAPAILTVLEMGAQADKVGGVRIVSPTFKNHVHAIISITGAPLMTNWSDLIKVMEGKLPIPPSGTQTVLLKIVDDVKTKYTAMGQFSGTNSANLNNLTRYINNVFVPGSGTLTDLELADLKKFVKTDEWFIQYFMWEISAANWTALENSLTPEIRSSPYFFELKNKLSFYFSTAYSQVIGTHKYVFMKKEIKDNKTDVNLAATKLISNYAAGDLISNSKVVNLVYFINDLATAKSSDDVAKAIDAFALPTGSYTIKRHARSNLSLNSYPGIIAGLERGSAMASTIGFTVPVGISYTTSNERGASRGLFVSVIDIAAFTRFHLDNDGDTPMIPDFNVSNILAPGIFFHYGFPNTPFSVNAGIQFAPDLITDVKSGKTNTETWMIGCGLVLDIPLLNLHTKPRF